MMRADRAPVCLSREGIVSIKTRALRKGLWYRILTRTERACVDLTIKVVDRVRSGLLAGLLCSVLRKLQEAAESQVARAMRDAGQKLAGKLGSIALGWGNESAGLWAGDLGFVRFLAVLHVNGSL